MTQKKRHASLVIARSVATKQSMAVRPILQDPTMDCHVGLTASSQ